MVLFSFDYKTLLIFKHLILLNIIIVFFSTSKRIINVGSAPLPTTSDQSILLNNGDSRVRVSCGHCNELFKVSN